MDHGKNVRGPALEKGNNYVMKTWGKNPVYDVIMFDGFVSGGQAYKVPTKQLKDMAPTDYYKFTGDAGEFRGKMMDNCLVHHTTEARITFFQLAGVSTEAVTVNADKPAKAPKVAKAPKAPKSEPKTEEPVVVAAEAAKTETAQERKRRLDNERKKQKRAEEKAAKEAAKSAATSQPAETIEQPAEQHAEPVEAASETVESEPETETESSEHAADEMPAHIAAPEETLPAATA